MESPVRALSAGQSARPVGHCGHEHVVEFYDTEEFLVDTVCDFVSPALHDGDVAIVVATAAHRSAFDAAIRATGLDLDAAVAAGRYLTFDAAELLQTFMVDGSPNAGRFEETIGGVIDRAGTGGRRIQIYGEMVALLWDAGDIRSAISLEDLWNDLAAAREFSLLCAYPMHTFEDDKSAAAFKRVCDQHTTVIPSEEYSRLGDADAQQRAVAGLQRELAALRADVGRLRVGLQADPGDRPAQRKMDRGLGDAADRAAAALDRQRTALNQAEGPRPES